jgi:ubiquinone/menaquinone biosynthesis C-methylase UbiE
MDNYKHALKIDINESRKYFEKSICKTEQHKALEKLLVNKNPNIKYKIADIACGGGSLTFHLSKLFINSNFYLVDYLEEGITIAKNVNKENTRNKYLIDDIYSLNEIGNSFDITFCWQTLSWLENPKLALENLIKITKKRGEIYLSSLFNIDHDVDIYSKVFDHTRKSSENLHYFNYNTYSKKTIYSWIGEKVESIDFFEFIPEIDLNYDGRGIGTQTIETSMNKRLQVSGGMLLNWYIMKITV